jgi:hypothetical protein
MAPILKSSLETSHVPEPFGATQEKCKYCLFKKQCTDDKPKELVQPFLQKAKKANRVAKPKKEKKDSKSAFLL